MGPNDHSSQAKGLSLTGKLGLEKSRAPRPLLGRHGHLSLPLPAAAPAARGRWAKEHGVRAQEAGARRTPAPRWSGRERGRSPDRPLALWCCAGRRRGPGMFSPRPGSPCRFLSDLAPGGQQRIWVRRGNLSMVCFPWGQPRVGGSGVSQPGPGSQGQSGRAGT